MPQPLTQAELNLLKAATQVIDAVPRFTPERRLTDHTVGCATLSSDGKIYTGINVFHYMGGPCAENVAFGNAAAGGVASAMSPGVVREEEQKTKAPRLTHVVAVANDGRGVINPCGSCRQMMADYYPDIKVIIKDDEGELRTVGVRELLPFAFVSSIWKVQKSGERAAS